MIKAKVTGKNQITIPSEILKKMNLKVGDYLGFKEENDSYTLVKIEDERRNICPVCGHNLSSLAEMIVHIHQKNYHLKCWYELTEVEKVKFILSKHTMDNADCEKLLKLANGNLNLIIDVYYNNLEKVNAENTEDIANLIAELLKQYRKKSKI